MFSLVTGVYESYFASPQINILLVGAQGAGKTTTLERIKVTHFRKRPPPPGIQQTPMPEELLRLLKGEEDLVESTRRTTANNNMSSPSLSPQTKKLITMSDHSSASSAFISPSATHKQMGTPKSAKKRLMWVCPAPKRYSVQQMKDDDDDEEVVKLIPRSGGGGGSSTNSNSNNNTATNRGENHNNNDDDDETTNVGVGAAFPALPDLSSPPPPPPGPQRAHETSIGSLDSVELPATVTNKHYRSNNATTTTAVAASNANPASSSTASSSSPSTPSRAQHQQSQQQQQQQPGVALEYDVQPKAKMISLSKIRPTIGMNLGKVDLCQAKCHVWDLGGRLVDLWERYYADADAVVFVWKLGKDVVPRDEDEDEDERPEITYELQHSLLNQVRSSVGDDIPFLILGHAHGGTTQECPVPVGPLYQTDALLPHYHNPMQALMVANAATGQGIQAAMEWLVPMAKRQLSVREKSMEKLP